MPSSIIPEKSGVEDTYWEKEKKSRVSLSHSAQSVLKNQQASCTRNELKGWVKNERE